MSEALTSGHSIPAAIGSAAAGATGSLSVELTVATNAFNLGLPIESVLERLRTRADCQRWNTIVAAILLQRQAGGNLAKLLNELATAFETSDRVDRDARAATAQARFTAWLVLSLPVGAACLMQVFNGSFLPGLFANTLSLSLAIAATLLQLTAWICVRRLSRPISRRAS
jgi:tight adherence protein B